MRLRAAGCGAASAAAAGTASAVWLASTRSSWRRSCVLGRRRRGHHILEAVELEHVELVDLHVDVDVGLLAFSFSRTIERCRICVEETSAANAVGCVALAGSE